MTASGRTTYHHGNLRAALIEAGVELARAGGPEAVAIREASRRVGVSHNAAYRHFPDRDGLLRAVAGRAMAALARLMEEMIEAVPEDGPPAETARRRLRATGRAYVRFALEEPGLFRTAFSVPRHMSYLEPGQGVGEGGLGPYELLGARLDELVATGGMPAARRPGAELVAWSGVHGLSMLELEGPLRELPPDEREGALTRLLDGLELALSTP